MINSKSKLSACLCVILFLILFTGCNPKSNYINITFKAKSGEMFQYEGESKNNVANGL